MRYGRTSSNTLSTFSAVNGNSITESGVATAFTIADSNGKNLVRFSETSLQKTAKSRAMYVHMLNNSLQTIEMEKLTSSAFGNIFIRSALE